MRALKVRYVNVKKKKIAYSYSYLLSSLVFSCVVMNYPTWIEIKDSLLKGRTVPMIKSDMPTFMGVPHAIGPEDLKDVDVVIIGAPYVASWGPYGGLSKEEWIASPKRVRQQSVKYRTGILYSVSNFLERSLCRVSNC